MTWLLFFSLFTNRQIQFSMVDDRLTCVSTRDEAFCVMRKSVAETVRATQLMAPQMANMRDVPIGLCSSTTGAYRSRKWSLHSDAIRRQFLDQVNRHFNDIYCKEHDSLHSSQDEFAENARTEQLDSSKSEPCSPSAVTFSLPPPSYILRMEQILEMEQEAAGDCAGTTRHQWEVQHNPIDINTRTHLNVVVSATKRQQQQKHITLQLNQPLYKYSPRPSFPIYKNIIHSTLTPPTAPHPGITTQLFSMSRKPASYKQCHSCIEDETSKRNIIRNLEGSINISNAQFAGVICGPTPAVPDDDDTEYRNMVSPFEKLSCEADDSLSNNSSPEDISARKNGEPFPSQIPTLKASSSQSSSRSTAAQIFDPKLVPSEKGDVIKTKKKKNRTKKKISSPRNCLLYPICSDNVSWPDNQRSSSDTNSDRSRRSSSGKNHHTGFARNSKASWFQCLLSPWSLARET